MAARNVVFTVDYYAVATPVPQQFSLIAFMDRTMKRFQRTSITVAALAVAVLMFRGLARWLVDRWWLQTVTDAPVWRIRVVAQVGAIAVFGGMALAVLGATLWWIARTARTSIASAFGPVVRYHQRFGPAHRWILLGASAYTLWRSATLAASWWPQWLMFWSAESLDAPVPEIGGDLSFYLFRLPLLIRAFGLVQVVLIVSVALAVAGHGASGALRLPRRPVRSRRAALTHIALLIAAWLVVRAVSAVFVGRAATATNQVGSFDGPGFTEVYVTRPALLVVAVVAVIAAVLVVRDSVRRRWRSSVVAGVTVLGVHVLGLVVAPWAVERVMVMPAEADRQMWSIEHNLEATLAAYGLGSLSIDNAGVTDGWTPTALNDSQAVNSLGVPLFTTQDLARALQVQVGTIGNRVADTDVLTYVIGGHDRLVALSARVPRRADLPERGWVQEHLVYTNGDGVVAVAVDVVDEEGRPAVGSAPELSQSASIPLYFAPGLDGWYVVSGSKRAEANGSTFAGKGIKLGPLIKRTVLATGLSDAQILLTSEVTSQSDLVMRRSLSQRLRELAPFLTPDSDPYPVVTSHGITWVLDAYTTSRTYPYAQFLSGEAAGPMGGAGVNFVNGSYRMTVDATTGETHLYRSESADPVADLWERVFPGLVEPSSAMPVSVAKHLRYPNDLFLAQTSMLGRYHVASAEALFSGVDRWAVTAATRAVVGQDALGRSTPVDLVSDDSFVALRTFGPGSSSDGSTARDELTAIAVAAHGSASSIELSVSDQSIVLSAEVAQSAIDAEPALARDLTLLSANGSRVVFGPMTPVLLDRSLGWVRAITVTGPGASSVPRLYGVAVVSKGQVAVSDSLASAIDALGQDEAE